MSTETIVRDEPQAEPVLVIRTFEAQIEEQSGRTLWGRIVPYNTPALVADAPHYEPYEEEWLPDVFDRNYRAAHRVYLEFEHERAMMPFGRGLELDSQPDALYAGFKVYSNVNGDTALEMYRDGVLTSFSVNAKTIKSARRPDGVVQRVKAHLDRVGLCRQGAFKDAKVLALRTDHVFEQRDDSQPIDPALAAGLARFITLPAAMQLRTAQLPAGLDQMPAGVSACSMKTTPGYTGGGACHIHDGTDKSMEAAMKKAQADANTSGG